MVVQCGCECTLCDDKADSNFFARVPDAPTTTECSYTYDTENFAKFCIARNTSNCGLQYSVPRQLINCALVSPPQWPPIYQLYGGLDFTQEPGPIVSNDQGVLNPTVSTTSFLHTAENEFSNAAMQHFIRDPDFSVLLSDPSIDADIQV